MAIQVSVLLNSPKKSINEAFADPGTTTGSGARVGVMLMTGTAGHFDYRNIHDNAIKQAVRYAAEQIHAGNYDSTNAKVFACTIGTENCRAVATSNDVVAGEAAVEVPVGVAGRTLVLEEAVRVARQYMRERLPDYTT